MRRFLLATLTSIVMSTWVFAGSYSDVTIDTTTSKATQKLVGQFVIQKSTTDSTVVYRADPYGNISASGTLNIVGGIISTSSIKGDGSQLYNLSTGTLVNYTQLNATYSALSQRANDLDYSTGILQGNIDNVYTNVASTYTTLIAAINSTNTALTSEINSTYTAVMTRIDAAAISTTTANTRLNNLDSSTSSLQAQITNLSLSSNTAGSRLDALDFSTAVITTRADNAAISSTTANTRLNNLDSSTTTITTHLHNLDSSTSTLFAGGATTYITIDSSTQSKQGSLNLSGYIKATTGTITGNLSAGSVNSSSITGVGTIYFNDGTFQTSAAGTGSSGGSGGGRNFFFHDDPTVAGSATFELLAATPTAGAEVNDSAVITAAAGPVLISSHVTLPGQPGVSVIPAGVWNFVIFSSITNTALTSVIKITISTRTPTGGEGIILIATSPAITASITTQYNFSQALVTNIAVSTDTRLVARVYGVTTGAAARTIYFTYEGSAHASYINSSIASIQRFTDLEDVPNGYALQGDKYVRVKPNEDGLMFVSIDTKTLTDTDVSLQGQINTNNSRLNNLDGSTAAITIRADSVATSTTNITTRADAVAIATTSPVSDNLGNHIATMTLYMNNYGMKDLGNSVVAGTILSSSTFENWAGQGFGSGSVQRVMQKYRGWAFTDDNYATGSSLNFDLRAGAGGGVPFIEWARNNAPYGGTDDIFMRLVHAANWTASQRYMEIYSPLRIYGEIQSIFKVNNASITVTGSGARLGVDGTILSTAVITTGISASTIAVGQIAFPDGTFQTSAVSSTTVANNVTRLNNLDSSTASIITRADAVALSTTSNAIAMNALGVSTTNTTNRLEAVAIATTSPGIYISTGTGVFQGKVSSFTFANNLTTVINGNVATISATGGSGSGGISAVGVFSSTGFIGAASSMAFVGGNIDYSNGFATITVSGTTNYWQVVSSTEISPSTSIVGGINLWQLVSSTEIAPSTTAAGGFTNITNITINQVAGGEYRTVIGTTTTFGATYIGTDETPFKNAIAAICGASNSTQCVGGGGTIFVQDGTYNIKDTTIPYGIELVCASSGILKSANETQPMLTVYGTMRQCNFILGGTNMVQIFVKSNSRWLNNTILYSSFTATSGTEYTDHTFRIDGEQNIVFKDLYMKNINQGGAAFQIFFWIRNSTNVTFDRVELEKLTVGTTGDAIFRLNSGAEDIKIINGRWDVTTRWMYNGTSGKNNVGLLISNNEFLLSNNYSQAGGALMLWDCTGISCNGITLSNNLINVINNTGANNPICYWYAGTFLDLNIENNVYYNPGTAGNTVYNITTAGVTNAFFHGNRSRGASTHLSDSGTNTRIRDNITDGAYMADN